MWICEATVALCLLQMTQGCFFPEELSSPDAGAWIWKIHRQEEGEKIVLFFDDNRMSVSVYKRQGNGETHLTSIPLFNRTCINAISSRKFLVSHEEKDKRPRYLCMEVVTRSKGLIQLKTSSSSEAIEPLLCYTASLVLNPRLFVSLKVLKRHHQISFLSGGYNMKIHSAQGDAYGCNSMELPMRLESECIGGDGVNFRFRYETCKENLPMEVDQRTYCVANWIDGRYSYSILRKIGHDDLWCLRAPLIRGQNFTATLFLNAICSSDKKPKSSDDFVLLSLSKVQHDALCQDEFPGCSQKRCTPYTELSCQKSCGICRSGKRTPLCKFPIPYRGDWLQNNFNSTKQISIKTSEMTIQNVGTFTCIPGGKQTKGIERKYALVSLFENGCVPRFTCVAFRRFGHSVLSYTLSQSITWPFPSQSSMPEAVCKDSSFSLDPRPINDFFRGRLDTFKTVVAAEKKQALVNCRFRNAYSIRGSFNGSVLCKGNFYQDCNDSTRLRMELNDCDAGQPIVDFQCLSVYKGRYWENITIVQNKNDPNDARCFIFSEVRAGEMLMMAASECDMQTWLWEVAGDRAALSKFQYEEENVFCKPIPTEPPTTVRVVQEVTTLAVASSTPESGLENMTLATEDSQDGDQKNISTESTSSLPDHRQNGDNLQNDSGNVGVVIATDIPPSSAVKKTSVSLLQVIFPTLTVVFGSHKQMF